MTHFIAAHEAVSQRRQRKAATKRRRLTCRQVTRDIFIAMGLFALVMGFAGLDVAKAENQASPLVSANQMNTGALLLKTKLPGQHIEAPRLGTDVAVFVAGSIARTKISQRFYNPTDGYVEAVYVFPLPDQAAVDTLKLRVGRRFLQGLIKSRDAARKIYEKARASGVRAALVEQQRPNIFTNEIANIGPGETVIVQIEYQQSITPQDGLYRLRVPLVVAPRFVPPPAFQVVRTKPGPKGGTGGFKVLPGGLVAASQKISGPVLHPDHGKTNPVTLSVSLDAGFALGEVKSLYHDVTTKTLGPGRVQLTLAKGAVPADKDFALSWRPAAQSEVRTTLFQQTRKDGAYLYAMLLPPAPSDTLGADVPGRDVLGRDVIFVLDVSGSMDGTSLDQAKQGLMFALDRLRPKDRFNMIFFSDTHRAFFEHAMAATAEHIVRAKAELDGVRAGGGTQMRSALEAALMEGPIREEDANRLRQVVFLTDGAIANEAELISLIAAKKGHSRIFTVGIGAAPNVHFMRRAAELGHGRFTLIGKAKEVRARMTQLLKKLENPVVTGLKLSWPSGVSVDAFPAPLPDLYAGEPLTFAAKISSFKGAVELTGRVAGKKWSKTVRLADAVPARGVARHWARAKIAQLEARRYVGQDFATIAKSVEKVALAHHLVSRQTSLIAIDLSPSRPAEVELSKIAVPLNLPEGWDFSSVFGADAVAPVRKSADIGPAQQSLLQHIARTKKAQDGTTGPIGSGTLQRPGGRFTAGRSGLLGGVAYHRRKTSGGPLGFSALPDGDLGFVPKYYRSAPPLKSKAKPTGTMAAKPGTPRVASVQNNTPNEQKTVSQSGGEAGAQAETLEQPGPVGWLSRFSVVFTLALIFTAMFAITFGLWRWFRRELVTPHSIQERS